MPSPTLFSMLMTSAVCVKRESCLSAPSPVFFRMNVRLKLVEISIQTSSDFCSAVMFHTGNMAFNKVFFSERFLVCNPNSPLHTGIVHYNQSSIAALNLDAIETKR